MKTTTKKDLIDRIAESNRLEFRDFGVFETKTTPARTAQNPKTLEKVDVLAKRRVVFKPGKMMREGLKDVRHRPNPSSQEHRHERAIG